MAHLGISLLGSIQITMDGQPITGFKSNKVRALLAYLAVEADKLHRRESLAGLLWPEWSEREALSNLRYTLSDLRQAIGDHAASPAYLIISRGSLQFNKDSDYWLDVTAFAESAGANKSSPTFIEEQEKAAGIYRGSFLDGFSVDGSPSFDEWALLTRERLARQAFTSLQALADFYEERSEYEKAKAVTRKQLEVEPWEESAHRQMMRVLALSGQRSAALAQYESCCKLLEKELDVEPSEETVGLYEQIRDGKLKASKQRSEVYTASTKAPSFLEMEQPRVDTPLVVAFESELCKMKGFLEQAMEGHGCVVFITGEAGSGKTSLIREFARRSQDIFRDLLVASGNSNAYTGIGDPYLPFREILELLTGDVEAKWAAGTITKDHALRIWGKLPVAVHALVEAGSDLIDTFVQRAALLERARASAIGQADWLAGLDQLLKRKPNTAFSGAALHQVDLFEQYTRVLQSLEHKSPLLLVVDDLQWADAGSINMLFHLGRRIKSNRIVIFGAYRSEEVALGRDGGRHPLEPLINEFRREFGDIVINLDQIAGRKFIETLLNSEPHHLGPSFREMLFHQTQGHPLFTVELLRGLQERGDIAKDPEGCWIESATLDWEKLPVRVEAAIQERIGRLSESLQKVLAVASVEGEVFTAEVAAEVRGTDKREMLEALSGELDKKHRLVHAQSIQRVDGKSLSRYKFRHILFQKYLYSSLDEVERAHLHEQVGAALEKLYGERVDVAVNAIQLARHFEEAKVNEKVIHYLHIAGIRAIQLSAYQEAIAHLSRGMTFLESLAESSQRDRQELDLLLALGISWQGPKGAQPDEVKYYYTRARELCKKIGTPSQMVQVLGGLAVLYYVRGEFYKTLELAEEGLALARTADDPLLMLLCHWYMGFTLFCLGDLRKSHEHLRHALDHYERGEYHHSLVYLRGSDAGLGAMAYDACCLWILGYPDQAVKLSQETLTLAHILEHPFTLADVLCYAGCLLNEMLGDGEALMINADELMRLSIERNLTGWLATGTRYWGEALALQGNLQEGIAQIREGMMGMYSRNIHMYQAGTLSTLAEKFLKIGDLKQGMNFLTEAFEMVEKTDERYWEAELHRIKGDLLSKQGDEIGAEDSLKKSIEVARKQSAKSLELRAVMSLCHLWEKQGRKIEALQLLTEIYNWFTEGFDTPDLIQARRLMEELS